MSDPQTKIERSAAKDKRQGVAPLREHAGGNKRNTRRWCKGKVGVEHQYVQGAVTGLLRWRWRSDHCAKCGRKKYVTLRDGS